MVIDQAKVSKDLDIKTESKPPYADLLQKPEKTGRNKNSDRKTLKLLN